MPAFPPHRARSRGWGSSPAALAAALLAVSGCGRETIDLAISQSTEHADGGAREAGSADSGARPDSGPPREARLPCTLGGTECVARGEVCVPETRMCGGCTNATESVQCKMRFARKCDPSTNECVGCLSDPDCQSVFGPSSRCDEVLRRCTAGCGSADDCKLAALAGFAVCDMGRSLCVECSVGTDCFPQGSGIKCDKGMCVECTVDANCNGGRCERGRCVR